MKRRSAPPHRLLSLKKGFYFYIYIELCFTVVSDVVSCDILGSGVMTTAELLATCVMLISTL